MKATNSNILVGLIAVKDLMIANLTERVKILENENFVLKKENDELYYYLTSLDNETTKENKVGFNQNKQ